MNHTPGPWTINQMKSPVYGTNGQLVAEAHGIGNGSRFIGTAYRDEDARLIAAAPEMLEALKELVKVMREAIPPDYQHAPYVWSRLNFAVDAITKAEGKG